MTAEHSAATAAAVLQSAAVWCAVIGCRVLVDVLPPGWATWVLSSAGAVSLAAACWLLVKARRLGRQAHAGWAATGRSANSVNR